GGAPAPGRRPPAPRPRPPDPRPRPPDPRPRPPDPRPRSPAPRLRPPDPRLRPPDPCFRPSALRPRPPDPRPRHLGACPRPACGPAPVLCALAGRRLRHQVRNSYDMLSILYVIPKIRYPGTGTCTSGTEKQMKLTIFAATGGIGRQLVDQALAAGHDVTAVARNPASLPAQVRPVTADLATAEPAA